MFCSLKFSLVKQCSFQSLLLRNLLFTLILSISSNFTLYIHFFPRLKVTIYAVKNPTGNTTDLNEKLSHIKDYMTRDDILKVLLDEDGNPSPNLTNDKELEVKGCY